MVGPDSAVDSSCTLMLVGVVLPWQDHVPSLGVVLEPALLLDKQVVAVAKSEFLLAATFPRKEGPEQCYTGSGEIEA